MVDRMTKERIESAAREITHASSHQISMDEARFIAKHVFAKDETVQPNSLNGWRSLKDDPPPPEIIELFVGHSESGQTNYVFRPDPSGKMVFWYLTASGEYVLDGYEPDVWYPGPPPIPGSDVERIRNGAFGDTPEQEPKS